MKVFRDAAILAGISSGGGQAISLRGKVGAKEACSGGKQNEECSAVVADHREIAKEQNESVDKSTKKSKEVKKSAKNSIATKVATQKGMFEIVKSKLFALHEAATAIKFPGDDLYHKYIRSQPFVMQCACFGALGAIMGAICGIMNARLPDASELKIPCAYVVGCLPLMFYPYQRNSCIEKSKLVCSYECVAFLTVCIITALSDGEK